jgi:hypothetical protein
MMGDLFDNLSHKLIHLEMEKYLYDYYEKTIYPPETMHPTPHREHPGGRFHTPEPVPSFSPGLFTRHRSRFMP